MTSPLFSFITRALHSAPMLQFIILFASLCAIVDAPGGPLGIICEIVPRTLIHFPFCGEALEAQGAVCYCFAIQRSRSACLWQPIGLRQRARGGEGVLLGGLLLRGLLLRGLLLRGLGDLVFQMAGLVIAAELAQRRLVELEQDLAQFFGFGITGRKARSVDFA